MYRVILILLLLQGCSSPPPVVVYRNYPAPVVVPAENFNYMSLLTLQEKIKKNITTKDQVIELLGVPNQISLNGTGREVLIWDKRVQQFEVQNGMNSTQDARHVKETMIAIEFSENGIVQKFSMRASSR